MLRADSKEGRTFSLKYPFRANGPGICLAQPSGLGIRVPKRTKGPKARPFARTSSIPNVSFIYDEQMHMIDMASHRCANTSAFFDLVGQHSEYLIAK